MLASVAKKAPGGLVIGEQVGKYEILQLLGEGGNGKIYLAQHHLLGGKVAIKFLLPEYAKQKENLLRFLQEAKTTTSIVHPGIVRVLDFDRHSDGGAYLVMEYLEGESLAERLQARFTLSLVEIAFLGKQVANALSAVHQKGIIHRDLKPDNIFLVSDPDIPGGERAKLLDFGIAKLAQELGGTSPNTAPSAILGTPFYMSPEQCRGAGSLDHRSDIYSLGCVLFEITCGEPPFYGTFGEVLGKHQFVPPPSPKELQPQIPPGLEALILRCLAKEPSQRPQSMSEIARTLHMIGAAMAIRARSGDSASLKEPARFQQLSCLKGHTEEVVDARFHPTADLVVTASSDKTAKLWDAKDGRLLALLQGHQAKVNAATFSPNGQRILTVSEDCTAKLWDPKTGQLVLSLDSHTREIPSAQFSPDGAFLVTTSWDKTAKLWDAGTGELLYTLMGHQGVVRDAQFSPDGAMLITASWDKTAKLWDTRTGALLLSLEGHEGVVWGASFSPDGTKIVTASGDETAQLWDAFSGAALCTLAGHKDEIVCARFSPKGSFVLTVSDDHTAKLWDPRTGALLCTLAAHADSVEDARFSPDERRVATASRDHSVRIWSSRDGRPIFTLEGHVGWVVSAQFSNDGQRLVTASRDRTARVWTV